MNRGQTPAHTPLTEKQTPMQENTSKKNTKNTDDDDYDNDDVPEITGNCNIFMNNWKILN